MLHAWSRSRHALLLAGAQVISKFPGGVQNYIKMARQWVSEHPGTESVKGQRFTSASSLGQQTASLGQETKSAGQVVHRLHVARDFTV